jgi:hypothetical protein
VLLCWDSSRLARDSEDVGWIRNRLRAHRRTGYEVSAGLDLFNVGAKVLGVMAEEYLVKLRADTQRGLKGRPERRHSPRVASPMATARSRWRSTSTAA